MLNVHTNGLTAVDLDISMVISFMTPASAPGYSYRFAAISRTPDIVIDFLSAFP